MERDNKAKQQPSRFFVHVVVWNIHTKAVMETARSSDGDDDIKRMRIRESFQLEHT
jgi:hypothetical protein